MSDPLSTLTDLLAPAFAEAAGRRGEWVDPVVRPSDHADAQANGALALGKEVGRNPRQLADVVMAADVLKGVATAEVAGPGFLNITLTTEFIERELAAMAADERLGVRTPATTATVVVDYSAPNVAKEMHVGHLRSTIIGDALVRLLEFQGNKVVRENHIGDWGRQFGMLIEHLVDVSGDRSADELSLGDLDAFYKQANDKFKDDLPFQQRSRERVVMLQGGEPETLRLWQALVAESSRHYQEIYRRLGVRLTSDDNMGESAYNDLLHTVTERLAKVGLLVESDGAEVVFPPGYLNREGEPLPLIVRNSVGGFPYATTDLATVIDRIERIGATVLLYVVGAPQALHLSMVWDVCRMAGWLPEGTCIEHVAFGSVLGADRKMMRSRSGDSIKLVDLLDEAVSLGQAKVLEKNPELPPEEIAATGRIIGLGAVKYADLSTDRVRDYVFDWERMLSFDGNTAPYLQYAYARIRSLFRRAGVAPETVRGTLIAVGEPAERALALRLLSYDGAVQITVDTRSPHKLCAYLYDLAQDFTAFYETCPVLRDGVSTTERASRLALADLTARVLAHGLDLLGIAVPERM